ncbi:MAG: Uncharacterised protein [Flavobacteriaceae bacterium]|nr:MAG: Uncharacterised protein [Flavobacteriaceae bacterium]
MQVSQSVVVPMLDARRMEVYSAVFSSQMVRIRDIKAQIITQDSFNTYLDKGKVTFIGDGVEKFKDVCTHQNAVFINDALPSASEMAKIATLKFTQNDTQDVAYFEPYYLKDFISL